MRGWRTSLRPPDSHSRTRMAVLQLAIGRVEAGDGIAEAATLPMFVRSRPSPPAGRSTGRLPSPSWRGRVTCGRNGVIELRSSLPGPR